jgi:hypothetical protein
MWRPGTLFISTFHSCQSELFADMPLPPSSVHFPNLGLTQKKKQNACFFIFTGYLCHPFLPFFVLLVAKSDNLLVVAVLLEPPHVLILLVVGCRCGASHFHAHKIALVFCVATVACGFSCRRK